MSVWEHTDSQVGNEEVGYGAERLKPVDDVDDQRIPQNTQHDDGAVGQNQHHLQAKTNTCKNLSEAAVRSSCSSVVPAGPSGSFITAVLQIVTNALDPRKCRES